MVALAVANHLYERSERERIHVASSPSSSFLITGFNAPKQASSVIIVALDLDKRTIKKEYGTASRTATEVETKVGCPCSEHGTYVPPTLRYTTHASPCAPCYVHCHRHSQLSVPRCWDCTPSTDGPSLLKSAF